MRGQMSVGGWVWILTQPVTPSTGLREWSDEWSDERMMMLEWGVSAAWGTPCLTGCCRTSCRVTRTWRRTSAASPSWGESRGDSVCTEHTLMSLHLTFQRLLSLKLFRKKTFVEMHSENKHEVFPNLLIFASFSLLRNLSPSFTLP